MQPHYAVFMQPSVTFALMAPEDSLTYIFPLRLQQALAECLVTSWLRSLC